MSKHAGTHHHPALDRRVTEFLSKSFITLRENYSIDEAMRALRSRTAGAADLANSHVVYFYVLNEQEQLVGILGSRHLLLAPGDAKVSALMNRNFIALSERETLFDAMEQFAMHRLMAVPVVDDQRQFLGIIELSLYTENLFDLAQNRNLNEVFQLIGLDLEQHKQGTPWQGFRMRMPWLLANITGGLICAALGSLFEEAVQKVVLVALFIPLILTLAESVSVQSMTLAIEQAARGIRVGSLRREFLTSLMLGLCTGLLVGIVSLFWHGPLEATLLIGGAVATTMLLASLLGRAVPQLMHVMKLNPRIASGPVTLAIVDVVAVTLYLGSATLVLTRGPHG